MLIDHDVDEAMCQFVEEDGSFRQIRTDVIEGLRFVPESDDGASARLELYLPSKSICLYGGGEFLLALEAELTTAICDLSIAIGRAKRRGPRGMG